MRYDLQKGTGKGTHKIKKRFTEAQTIAAVKKLKSGVTAKELSRQLGFSQETLYHWKKKFLGMDVSEARRLKEMLMSSLDNRY